MFLLVWTFHGLIYRWRPTRLTDETVERPLERTAKPCATRSLRWRGGLRARKSERS